MQWSEVLEMPYLQNLPFKIELNRFGQILMSPASNLHSEVTPFPKAPEICVEITSPSNTKAEIDYKISLYFAHGAQRNIYRISKSFKTLWWVASIQLSTRSLHYRVEIRHLFLYIAGKPSWCQLAHSKPKLFELCRYFRVTQSFI
jgi:hypothetical protein